MVKDFYGQLNLAQKCIKIKQSSSKKVKILILILLKGIKR